MTEVITPVQFAGLKVIKARQRQPTFNMLIFGDPGVGKTHLAGSADAVPAMRKVLYMDVESGSATLKSAWPDVELLELPHPDSSKSAWGQFIDVYHELKAGSHDYRTVVIDTVSELNDHCIDFTAAEARERKPDSFDDVLEIRDWNKVASRMIRMIRLFRDLPMCTIFIAHMKEEKDPKTMKLTKGPLLNGQLFRKVPAVPDIVMYMWVEEVQDKGNRRLLLTQKTSTCIAKARGVTMPAVLGEDEDVSMSMLHNYIITSQNPKGS